AFDWWNKAAQKGNVVSQYNLALCYDNAWGVTRSKANAVKWFIEAAKNKHKEAIAKVEELKKQYKPTRVPTPTKKGDYSGVVEVKGGIVYPDDRKNIFVYIPDTDIVTMTDDKGRFFLRGVKNVNDVHAIVARKGKSGQPGLNIKGTIL
ncbi:MAG: sel1 repeat family protein, partial [Bacteroidaceae bacterium]|nr:sel1 repeat family protein [Bacteroidaceae bacterium]